MHRKLVVGVLVALVSIVLLSELPVLAGCFPENTNPSCIGNSDYDCDVDGSDASRFKQGYGRGPLSTPCPPSGPAPVPRTGQTVSYATADDGDLEEGVSLPQPRFLENDCGAMDLKTGLQWSMTINETGPWDWCVGLCPGGACGPTDYAYRLANLNELQSVLNYNYHDPALSNTQGTGPFTEGHPFYLFGVTSGFVWTSTTCSTGSQYAYAVDISLGVTACKSKTETHYCWCVQ